MKTTLTIILMLIVLNVAGQSDSTTWCAYSDSVLIKTLDRDEIIRDLIYSEFKLINLLTYYKEDCHNDSVLGYIPSQCNIPECLVYHSPTTGYIHRQPTFEGFINWLNTKK